jgi:benzoyl-CoA reductase subunit A
MNICVGIDLGSTTTKAVVLGEQGRILGRGITNSRSNYAVACDVALCEALIDARFSLLGGALDAAGISSALKSAALTELELRFREQQYRGQLASFHDVIHGHLESQIDRSMLRPALVWILERMDAETRELFADGANRKSDFFRDLAGGRYLNLAEEAASAENTSFDRLVGLFDKAIRRAILPRMFVAP